MSETVIAQGIATREIHYITSSVPLQLYLKGVHKIMNKHLTKAQVQELFDKESMLIGKSDGVPLCRAEQLFGRQACNYAFVTVREGNAFGVGDYDLPYLGIKGFQAAASYHNVEMIRDAFIKEVETA